ncbi:MAG: hypothetical protein HFF51_07025 [Lawsonibacter sp.]|nr:hypothetical protein [Lawsonibacter sp.]
MKLLTEWAITSSVLILIVLAVRFLLKDRLSARLKYALWGVVLLRLLVPFQVELPAPVSDAVPLLVSNAVPAVERWEEPSIPVFPQEDFAAFGFSRADFHQMEPGEIIPTDTSIGYWQKSQDGETITRYLDLWSPAQIVTVVWSVGTGLTGAAILLSNLRFSLRLKKRREPVVWTGGQCPPLQDLPIPVYTAAHLPSPCLFGVFFPAVYLTPGAAEDAATLRHVLAHELTHYAHRDHLWSLLRCLALALHWYNPLVWLAVGLSKGDGELACDEGAVARLGEEERIPYGRTLVDMVAARSLRPGDLLSCSTAMTGGKKSITQRVSALVKKPETVKTALFAVIAVVALSAVFVFAEREEPVRNLYGPYRYQVSHTQAVQFSPSPLSSQIYPDAITDPDLLEKALEILDSAADLLNTPEELGLDLSEAPFTSPRVTLLENLDDSTSGHTYLLYTVPAVNRDWCLLVTPAEMGAESYRVAGILDVSAPGGLELLARQQRGRGEKVITPSVTPELEEFFTQLEAAQSIYVGQPMISSAMSPGLISDPEALVQAKELLGKATGPLQLGKDITEEELLNIRRSLSSAVDTEPVHITPEELKNMLFMRGNPILLCPGPEVTPDLEFRHWLADNTLLLWDAELEENPKVLATFSEDVYSQLAELAWNEKANRAHPFTGNVGLSFLGLAPGEERVREQAFVIPENAASIQFSLTYDRPILTLEFGLRAADGTEYVQQADGGRSNGTLEAVPAGTYQIFVRNLGDLHDYTQFPAYQEDLADNYATGAINYQIAE